MAHSPQVSIILGSYNRKRFLKVTIQSIREEQDRCPFEIEIIVVDGGSSDGSMDWLVKQKDIKLIVQHNRGEWRGRTIELRSWGYFMNLGFKIARGKYICMLSDDCLVVPGAIASGYDLFEQRLASGEKLGAVAFYWRNWPEQQRYWVGLTFGNRLFVNHGMYLKCALEEVGYIDEENYSFYHADGDLCMKMWERGYTCIPSPESFVEHFSHASKRLRDTNLRQQENDWKQYESRWGWLGKPDQDWLEKEYRDPNETAKLFTRRWFKP
jgi:glycosyltransferase involved in cell wall biosynthesis